MYGPPAPAPKSTTSLTIALPSTRAIGQTIFNFDTCAGCFRQSGDLIEVLMQLNRARDINDINTLDPKMPDRKRLRIRRFLLNLTITIKEPSVFGKL